MIDKNEPTIVCGRTLIQSKAVQAETSRWIEEAHPHFRAFKRMTALAVLCGFVAWNFGVNSWLLSLAFFPILLYILVMKKFIREYNKQAPEELRVK